jgi:hypothetical protein
LGADTFEDGVGSDAGGELEDLLDAGVAAFGDDVGGAELTSDFLAVGVAAHLDDPVGSQLRRGKYATQSDGAVTDDDDRAARSHISGHGRVPAGGHHVGQREQSGDHRTLGLAAVVAAAVEAGLRWLISCAPTTVIAVF